MIMEEMIARINALARKSRTKEGLTESEKAEQTALRQAYVEAFKQSLQAQLDHTSILEPDGTLHKLSRRE